MQSGASLEPRGGGRGAPRGGDAGSRSSPGPDRQVLRFSSSRRRRGLRFLLGFRVRWANTLAAAAVRFRRWARPHAAGDTWPSTRGRRQCRRLPLPPQLLRNAGQSTRRWGRSDLVGRGRQPAPRGHPEKKTGPPPGPSVARCARLPGRGSCQLCQVPPLSRPFHQKRVFVCNELLLLGGKSFFAVISVIGDSAGL